MGFLIGYLCREESALQVLMRECSDDVDGHPHPSIQFEATRYAEHMSLALTRTKTVTLRASILRSQAKHSNEVVIYVMKHCGGSRRLYTGHLR